MPLVGALLSCICLEYLNQLRIKLGHYPISEAWISAAGGVRPNLPPPIFPYPRKASATLWDKSAKL